MRLDDRERPSCVKEVEVSSSLPFIRTGGKFWLCLLEMTVCFALLWLNETKLSLPHVFIGDRWREARLKRFCGCLQRNLFVPRKSNALHLALVQVQ